MTPMDSADATVVQGRALDAKGRPVAGARVGWASGPVDLPDVMLLTDAKGRFTIAAPVPGDYTLRCESDRSGSASLALQAAGEPLTVTFQLPR